MSAAVAHEKAAADQLVLIDIRSPKEWRDTGIGASATPISMHLPGFIEKVAKATGGDTSARDVPAGPIAAAHRIWHARTRLRSLTLISRPP